MTRFHYGGESANSPFMYSSKNTIDIGARVPRTADSIAMIAGAGSSNTS
jgi:hypothetical protein